MRIFLDVGAHLGETLDEVVKDVYGFDRIVAFEPSASCLPALEDFVRRNPRVEICAAGLSNRTTAVPLFHAGSVAGSVIGTIAGGETAHGTEVETVNLIEAGTWLRENTSPTDFIVMKTNCEGSEVDIIENLMESGLLDRIYVLLITFDIRGYPGGLAIESRLRRRLSRIERPNFCFADDVMVGMTHRDRIRHWLGVYGVDSGVEDVEELRRRNRPIFERYARKSGRFVRFEHAFKSRVSYASFPEPVKNLLKAAKRAFGLQNERKPRVN